MSCYDPLNRITGCVQQHTITNACIQIQSKYDRKKRVAVKLRRPDKRFVEEMSVRHTKTTNPSQIEWRWEFYGAALSEDQQAAMKSVLFPSPTLARSIPYSGAKNTALAAMRRRCEGPPPNKKPRLSTPFEERFVKEKGFATSDLSMISFVEKPKTPGTSNVRPPYNNSFHKREGIIDPGVIKERYKERYDTRIKEQRESKKAKRLSRKMVRVAILAQEESMHIFFSNRFFIWTCPLNPTRQHPALDDRGTKRYRTEMKIVSLHAVMASTSTSTNAPTAMN